MLRFLNNGEIDRLKWDAAVAGSPGSLVYVNSWFLDLVSPGWCGLVSDDYRLVFPLPVKKKAGFRYLMQPAFTQRFGWLSPDGVSQQEKEEVLAETVSRFRYIHINLPLVEWSAPPRNARIIPRSNFELRLHASYEELSACYSDNLRRNLRKASTRSLASTVAQPGELIRLFREFKGSGIKYLRPGHYAMLERLVNSLIGRELCRVDAVSLDGELCAGIIWVVWQDRAIMLFSALSRKGREAGAMPLLVDQFIRENAGKTMMLDFEGSDDRQIARFYASFGAQDHPYVTLHKEDIPFPVTLPVIGYRKIREWIQKIT